MSFNISIKRYIREARAEETRRIKIEGSSVLIGTGAGNEIQLEGLGVSINHAIIEKADDGTYWITDLGSSDGTYVNNNPISEKRQLADRDEVKIGLYTLLITIPASTEEPAAITVTQQVVGVEDEDEDEDALTLDKKQERVKYVSKYKLSTSILTKTILSVLGVSILVFLTVYWVTGQGEEAFSPGQLSDAHTQFNNDCGKCHTLAWSSIPDIPDDPERLKNHPCLQCHEVNLHSDVELFHPNCAQCHSEHRGNPVLANINDKFCTQCHSNLLTEGYIPSSKYERQILSFTSGHPEFAVVVRSVEQNEDKKVVRVRMNEEKNLIDNTPIKLNHKKHLEPDLRGDQGPENLSCGSCHRVDAKGEYTLPIGYERDCARCHTLEFDPRFGSKVVPHESTEVVDEFLQKTYSEYAVNNVSKLRLGANANSVKEWVSLRVKEAESILFRNKCTECHTIEEVDGGLPKVVNPQIPVRWLPHGKFDHELHVKNLRLSCNSCHAAEDSEQTTDVLMPSINNCQECHSADGGAKTECVLCHHYHQRDEMTILNGTKSIKEIIDGK